MTDIEVVELVTEQPVLLVYEPGDPLAGAEIVSVSTVPPPSSGGGQSHTYTQATPASVWLIVHPLPFTPSGIRVTGPDGGRLYPRRESYPASGRVRLDFTRPVAGTAYLS